VDVVDQLGESLGGSRPGMNFVDRVSVDGLQMTGERNAASTDTGGPTIGMRASLVIQ
jgi:hypothetical protein